MLGGLIQEQDNGDAAGILILHQIPVLGALFGSRNDTAARTELIVMMTPRLMTTDQEARDINEEIHRQFQAVLDRSTMARPIVPPR